MLTTLQLPTVETAPSGAPPEARSEASTTRDAASRTPNRATTNDDGRVFGHVLALQALPEPTTQQSDSRDGIVQTTLANLHEISPPNTLPVTAAAMANVHRSVGREIPTAPLTNGKVADFARRFESQIHAEQTLAGPSNARGVPHPSLQQPPAAGAIDFLDRQAELADPLAAESSQPEADVDLHLASADGPQGSHQRHESRFATQAPAAGTSDQLNIVNLDGQSMGHELSGEPSKTPHDSPLQPQRAVGPAKDPQAPLFGSIQNTGIDNSPVSPTTVAREVPTELQADTEMPPVSKGPWGYQLDVEPPGLDGKVMVLVRQSHDGIEAHLDAPVEATQRLLQHNLTAIREHLESTGVDLGGLGLGFHEGGHTDGDSAGTYNASHTSERSQGIEDRSNAHGGPASDAKSQPRWDGQINMLA